MKAHKLLLIQDTRNTENVITYKEFVGRKFFWKKPYGFTDQNKIGTVFNKKLNLYDHDTNQFRKQHVMCQVISVEHKYLVIGVK